MQLGWIDFSKTERSKILSVLDLLSEGGTLDQLGIAPIRDGFANIFFPGTTTIQTRAKYFFIIPYALKQLELSSETNPNKVIKMLDQIERDCGEIFLAQNRKESGVIGKDALQRGSWVKQPPTAIYWTGLKRYGIFLRGNMSLTEYIRAICSMKTQKNTLRSLGNRNDRAEENERDDQDAGDLFKMQFWKVPTYKAQWMDELTMSLNQEEAYFLKKQIIDNCEGSMLAYILEQDMHEFLACPSFRELGAIMDKFPEQMQEDYRMALEFSDFLYAIRTVYNIIVSDGKNDVANDEYEIQKPNWKQLADIDMDAIKERLGLYRNATLFSFLKQAQACMLTGDIVGLRKCITDREIFLKGAGRAKTNHVGEFDSDKWFGGGMLDYRFSQAKTMISDIMESEGERNAES